MTALDAALEYVARGWAVLPLHSVRAGRCACGKTDCDSPGKHPLGILVPHGVHGASTDPAVITSWWARFRDANVGVATGAVSGFFVLDVDPRHRGDETLDDLERTHGSLPDGPVQLTGGGGRHLLFCHPGLPIPNKVGIAPGLDLRGDGGFIAVAPSRHASGRLYAWELTAHPNDVPPPPAPDWLLDLRHRRGDHGGEARCATGKRIPEGERNATLARLAGRMRWRGMTEATIATALLAENSERCEPPLAKDEVRKIAASIARYSPAGGTGERDHAEVATDRVVLVELEHLTDVGNAKRLVRNHGRDLRFCAKLGGWFVWDGRRWKRDETGEVERRAKATVLAMYAEASSTGDERRRTDLAKHAAQSESEKRLRAMIALAESEPAIATTQGQFDADPWALNVENGTLDLRTGKLRPHRREDLIAKLAPVAYDAHAMCPTFDAFLTRIFGSITDLICFLQRAVGYSLTGSTVERLFFILWGGGRNGKTTLLEIMRFVLGDHAMRTPVQMLLAKRGDGGIPNDVARLVGVRFVTASEADEGKRLAEAQIKDMTGGDTICARFLHREFFDFKPEFKLWLATNHKPVIKGTDEAIWDRIRLVPFTVRIPEGEQDKHLVEKLKAEAPGILRWAVEGCLAWQREGLGVPIAVSEATAGYRREMDVLGQFIDECCLVAPEAKGKAKDLFEAYKAWCEAAGDRPITQREFGQRLSERGFERKHRERGWWWLGVGLLIQADPPDPEIRVIRQDAARESEPRSQGQQGSDGSGKGPNGEVEARQP